MPDTESHMEVMLLLVLDAALIHAGKSRADVARHLNVSEATISRRMAGKSAAVKVGGLDAFVSAVSRLTGVPSLWLWQHALNSWDDAAPLGPGIWSAIEKPQGRARILEGMVEALILRDGAGPLAARHGPPPAPRDGPEGSTGR